jgi:hypothetical protein
VLSFFFFFVMCCHVYLSLCIVVVVANLRPDNITTSLVADVAPHMTTLHDCKEKLFNAVSTNATESELLPIVTEMEHLLSRYKLTAGFVRKYTATQHCIQYCAFVVVVAAVVVVAVLVTPPPSGWGC